MQLAGCLDPVSGSCLCDEEEEFSRVRAALALWWA